MLFQIVSDTVFGPWASWVPAKGQNLRLAFYWSEADIRAITAPPMAPIGDENAGCAPASPSDGAAACNDAVSATPIHLKPVYLKKAVKLRKEAQVTPHGIERERLMRRARQAETGSHVSEWLRSPGLQPPK